MQSILDFYDDLMIYAERVVQACTLSEPVIESPPLRKFLSDAREQRERLRKITSDPSGLDGVIIDLKSQKSPPPNDVSTIVSTLKAYVDALPEPSKEDAAKEFLILAQKNYDICLETSSLLKQANERANCSLVYPRYLVKRATKCWRVYMTRYRRISHLIIAL